ncbi:VWA domain-containing protein [Ideonella sp. A 288]|uniref:vWA domain-containing protein n=1 Tax=Ideonella sp. A 288 TaxID=1962181 RepID=UPI000B4AA589|nr:VWA domain-containing protein [Ideonella sp. A 288]
MPPSPCFRSTGLHGHDTRRHGPAGRHPRAAARPLALAAAMLAVLLSLPACSHAPGRPADGSAPLPGGWSSTPELQAPARSTSPPWGVPSFEPPSARHCSGPARVREQGGQNAPAPSGWLGRPGGADHAARDVARRADASEAKSAGGSTAAAPPLAAAAATLAERAAVPSMLAPAPWPAAGPRTADAVASGRAVPSIAPPQAPAAAQNLQRPAETVTAGMVDDNAAFTDYLAYRTRSRHLNPRDRDQAERYRVEVRDAAGRPAADAEVALSWPGARAAVLVARTDAAGQAWLHPRALLAPEVLARQPWLEVQVRATHGEVQRAALQRGQKPAVQVQLRHGGDAPARVPLDLVFLVDATGSMADEIHKLRDSLRSIADRVGALPSQPDLCWGLVAYRDHGDAFVTRTHDLTDDLGAFQHTLRRLQAGGGGDYPEALDEALDEAVHRVSWRGPGTSRLLVLLGDAPPHVDRHGPHHDEAAAAALARGIKLHAVGASGLDPQGQAVFRQLAQATGGRFVFLTYRDAQRPGSGPGRETTHDVHDYSVDTLDELIVRLVRDELAPRGQP